MHSNINDALPDLSSQSALKLRRCIAVASPSLNFWKKASLDLTDSSNKDVVNFTNSVKSGKFRHPRALQMQHAAKAGVVLSPKDGFAPEEWLNEMHLYCTPTRIH